MNTQKNTFCVPISDVKPSYLHRIPAGINAIDWIYGYTIAPNGKVIWGFPMGKISLWYGEKGVGKSRIAIEIAKALNRNGHKILFIQTETTMSDFAQWAKNISFPQNFLVGNADTVSDIVQAIYEIRPTFVFIDSVNEIREFCNGNKREARLVIQGEEDNVGLKKAVTDVGCHLIMLAQLNQDGSIKGGTSLPHLVDTEVKIYRPTPGDTAIGVSIAGKHRYGRTGPQFGNYWMHTDTGIVPVSECEKNDEIWCKSKGIQFRYPASERTVHGEMRQRGKNDGRSGFYRFIFGNPPIEE